jgi:hypothetical protein
MSSRPPMEELVEVVNLTHPLPRVGYIRQQNLLFPPLFWNRNNFFRFGFGSDFGKISVPVPAPVLVPDPDRSSTKKFVQNLVFSMLQAALFR